MILKVINKDSVEMFDGFDRVGARDLNPDQPIGVSSNCVDFTDRPMTEEEAGFTKTEIWLMKGDTTIRQIIAFKPVYLLGNDGKTIDKF